MSPDPSKYLCGEMLVIIIVHGLCFDSCNIINSNITIISVVITSPDYGVPEGWYVHCSRRLNSSYFIRAFEKYPKTKLREKDLKQKVINFICITLIYFNTTAVSI